MLTTRNNELSTLTSNTAGISIFLMLTADSTTRRKNGDEGVDGDKEEVDFIKMGRGEALAMRLIEEKRVEKNRVASCLKRSFRLSRVFLMVPILWFV